MKSASLVALGYQDIDPDQYNRHIKTHHEPYQKTDRYGRRYIKTDQNSQIKWPTDSRTKRPTKSYNERKKLAKVLNKILFCGWPDPRNWWKNIARNPAQIFGSVGEGLLYSCSNFISRILVVSCWFSSFKITLKPSFGKIWTKLRLKPPDSSYFSKTHPLFRLHCSTQGRYTSMHGRLWGRWVYSALLVYGRKKWFEP